MSWRTADNRKPWRDRNRRGRGGFKSYRENRYSQNAPWRESRHSYSTCHPELHSSFRDSSPDDKAQAEKKKTASLVKNKLERLTVEDKSESMKLLLTQIPTEKSCNVPNEVKEAVEKDSRRIAHVPKPIKPVPPPPTLPPLLAEHLESDIAIERAKIGENEKIERRLMQDLISMPIKDLKNMVARPSSKDNHFLTNLMKKTRVSLSDAMRKLAEHKLQITGSEYPLSELENLVDPDLAVDVCRMPIETIQALREIFDLNLDGDLNLMNTTHLCDSLNTSLAPVSNFEEETESAGPFLWHMPYSIDINKSYLPTLAPESSTAHSIDGNSEQFSGSIDLPTLPSKSVDVTYSLPQPVPPPEPLEIIMEKNKQAIKLNKLNEKLKEADGKITELASPQMMKSEIDSDLFTLIAPASPTGTEEVCQQSTHSVVNSSVPPSLAVQSPPTAPIPEILVSTGCPLKSPKQVIGLPDNFPIQKARSAINIPSEHKVDISHVARGNPHNNLEKQFSRPVINMSSAPTTDQQLSLPDPPTPTTIKGASKSVVDKMPDVSENSATLKFSEPNRSSALILGSKVEKLREVTKKLSLHEKLHNMENVSQGNKAIKKIVSQGTQTRLLRLKNTSSQCHVHKLISQACQVTPTPIAKYTQSVQTQFTRNHAIIQTICRSPFQDAAIQTDVMKSGIVQTTQTDQKSFFDKYTQHTFTTSNRGIQTKEQLQLDKKCVITLNKNTQTKVQEKKKSEKNRELYKKNIDMEMSSKTPPSLATTIESCCSLENATVEKSSLFKEFSALEAEVRALGTGSFVRKRLVASMLTLMSSTFKNFSNLFSDLLEKSKPSECNENRKEQNKNEENHEKRKRVRSSSTSSEGERKGLKIVSVRTCSSSNNEEKVGTKKNINHKIKKLSKKLLLKKPQNNQSLENRNNLVEALNIEKTNEGTCEENRLGPVFSTKFKKMKNNNDSTFNMRYNPENEESEKCNLLSKKEFSESSSSLNNHSDVREATDRAKTKVGIKKRKRIISCQEEEEPHLSPQTINLKGTENSKNDDSTTALVENSESKVCDASETETSPTLRSYAWYKELYGVRECFVRCSMPSDPLQKKEKVKMMRFDSSLSQSSSSSVKHCDQSEFIFQPDVSSLDCIVNSQVKKEFEDEDKKGVEVKKEAEEFKEEDKIGVEAKKEAEELGAEIRKEEEEVKLNRASRSFTSEENEEQHNRDADNYHYLEEKSVTTASEISLGDHVEHLNSEKKKNAIGQIEFFGHTEPISDFKVSGNHLIAASGNSVLCFSFKSGKRKRMYRGHKTRVTALCLLAKKDGEVVFTAGHDNIIRAFSVQTSTLLRTTTLLDGVPLFLISIGASVVDGKLYAFLNNGNILCLNPKSLKIENKVETGESALICAAAAGEVDGKRIVFVSTVESKIFLKDMEKENMPEELDWGLQEPAQTMLYHGEMLYCASKLSQIITFNLSPNAAKRKKVIECSSDIVGLCLVEHCILAGSSFGEFSVINLDTQTVRLNFSKEGVFNQLTSHKKMVVGSCNNGKLIAWPLPHKVRKLFEA